MPDLIISCLSQKGGVGKSTIARLIARTYAVAGWEVKICDFNTTQLTSHKWCLLRAANGHLPAIASEPYSKPTSLRREDCNLVVADGRPDSDQSSLEIARLSNLVVIPTGLPLDDLEPQLMFANELVAKGVPKDKLMFVLNKTTESKNAVNEARTYLRRNTGYYIAEIDIAAKTSYQKAQNHGQALSEVAFLNTARLEERADLLAAEIVQRANALMETAA